MVCYLYRMSLIKGINFSILWKTRICGKIEEEKYKFVVKDTNPKINLKKGPLHTKQYFYVCEKDFQIMKYSPKPNILKRNQEKKIKIIGST